MLLLANGIAGVGNDLLLALGTISAVFPAILIAAAVLMLIRIKRQNREPSTETVPADSPEVAAADAAMEAAAEPALAAEPVASVSTVSAAEPVVPVVPVTPTRTYPTNRVIRYRKGFKAKLIQSPDIVKEWYSRLKNAFLSYKRTGSRSSWQADSINTGRTPLGKFVIRGKTLCLYLALNPEDYAGTKYRVERATEKRYESVPCLFKITGARRAKYALDLISDVAEKFSLVPVKRRTEVDYRPPFEDTPALLARGLIRKV